MGIINCTPDSFYPGSRRETIDEAVARALSMEKSGADIIDIGGESTRPGSEYVDDAEESERVLPVIREIRDKSEVIISVDTRKASVAEKALEDGADIVNDISALRDDPELPTLVAERKVPVVLMHMRGTPKNMQIGPYYENATREIIEELEVFCLKAIDAGIDKEKIIVDPGIGFGKRFHDNLTVIKNLSSFKRLGFPLLVGLSRKSFLGTIISEDGKPLPVEERLFATIAANAFCAMEGADILRVHDVKETVDMLRTLQAIKNS